MQTSLDPLALPLEGTQLIEASAGTGKTYTITTIVLRLLLERELPVDRITVVTFTRAATSELRDRIRRRIAGALAAFETGEAPVGDQVLEQLLQVKARERAIRALASALRDLDRAAIFTIHGFAQRVLQEHAFESGARFDLELVGEQRTLVTEVAYDFWAAEIATLPERCWRAVQSCDVTLRSVVALAHVAAAWPDLPLSVDVSRAAPDELEGRLQRLEAAAAQLAEVYRRDGEEAWALLGRPGLHQRYYAPAKLDEYRRELELLCHSRPDLSAKGPDFVKHLAAGAIKANKGFTAPEHPLFEAVLAFADAREECRRAARAFVDGLRCRLVAFARERVAAEHERAGTQSFDDLLYSLRAALRANGRSAEALAQHIRTRYPVALIDEFQDTDPVQYEIFRRVYGGARRGEPTALFLIGDPKQAIYAFRGADIHAYLQAARDAAAFGEGRQGLWTLTTNYRSDPGFLAALNHLFGRVEQPFLHPDIGYTPVSAPPGKSDVLFRGERPVPPLELVYLTREAAGRSAQWEGTEEWQLLAAREVLRLLRGEVTLRTSAGHVPVEPRHIAVLTRTNRQAQDIQERLRQLGIPSVLQGDRTVFEAPEATELALVLRALAEPTSSSAVCTALATRFLGLDAQAIAALAEDESEWEEWSLRFREWHAVWAERGFMQALEQVLRDRQVVQRTLEELDGERRMTNLRHLAELLHQAECERHLGIPGLLQWFDEARVDPSRHGVAPEAQQLRLESDADAVVLTTMHKSKGLEYPIVVLPFLGAKSAPFSSEQENLKFHNPKSGHRLELDVRARELKTEALELATQEHQAEAMRLAYVALTRARHHAVVLWGGVTGAFSSLGYLLHRPPATLGGLGVDVATRLRELDDAARLAELEHIAASSGGTIALRRATLEEDAVWTAPGRRSGAELAPLRLTRPVPAGVRTSSFSAMARSAQVLSRPAREGRDVDEETGRERGPEAAPSSGLRSTQASGVTLAEFPRGPKPGELLHAVLEKVPFGDGEVDGRRLIVEAELKRYGFSAELSTTVERALEEILRTPLAPEDPFTLGELRRDQRVCEMEFTLPVALAGEAPLSARALSEAMAAEARAPWDRAYLRRLARLGFGAWSGFLRGFIDLVFERGGAYFVVDYKSNHLGGALDDYRPEQLTGVMGEHHYYLQYVLYSVALHRYLGQRLADYDPTKHFGGVYYLFLRGMHPSTGPESGVFFHRPSVGLLEQVAALFHQERSAACG
jgi:exodeoxyribonuclease V beta subunit